MCLMGKTERDVWGERQTEMGGGEKVLVYFKTAVTQCYCFREVILDAEKASMLLVFKSKQRHFIKHYLTCLHNLIARIS